MDYEITPQREAYLNARGHIILMACPGSGKTTSIVYKLGIVCDYCYNEYGSHAGVACLSFTNKACGELHDKFTLYYHRRLQFPHVISTIDSFITQYIVFPFGHLLGYWKGLPTIINDDKQLHDIYFISVIKDGKEQIIPSLKGYNSIIFRYPPEKISFDVDGFKFNNKPIPTNLIDYSKQVVSYRIHKGILTSQDVLWLSNILLKKYPHISEIIVNRHSYVIIDEAQDLSKLQFMIFDKLKNAGLKNIEYIGDICQSIYGFRNANPETLNSLCESRDWTTLYLSENRRSNQRIIDLFSTLMPKHIPNIRSHKVDDLNIPIVVYRYNQTNVAEIRNDFKNICMRYGLKRCIVLSRGDSLCKELSGVGTEIEFWKSTIPYVIIKSQLAFSNNRISEALRGLRWVWAELLFKGAQHKEKREFLNVHKNDIESNALLLQCLRMMPSLNESFEIWTEKAQQNLKLYLNLPVMPDFKIKKKMNGYNIKEIAKTPIEHYYSSNLFNSDYRNNIQTIHAVKGATYDAVLVFLSSDSRGGNISLKDIPKSRPVTMTEKQRIIYVALSRAAQFLSIAIPESIPVDYIAKQFKGHNISIKSLGMLFD